MNNKKTKDTIATTTTAPTNSDQAKLMNLEEIEKEINGYMDNLKTNKDVAAKQIFAIAKALITIKEEKLYLNARFKTFKEYCNSKRVCGIKYLELSRYIKIYNSQNDYDIVSNYPMLSMTQLLTLSEMEYSLQKKFLKENPDIIQASTKEFNKAAKKMIADGKAKARIDKNNKKRNTECERTTNKIFDESIKEANESTDKDVDEIKAKMKSDIQLAEETKRELEKLDEEFESQPREALLTNVMILRKERDEANNEAKCTKEMYEKQLKEAQDNINHLQDIMAGMKIENKLANDEARDLETKVKDLEDKLNDDSRIDEELLKKKIAEATKEKDKEIAQLKNKLNKIEDGMDLDTVVDDSDKVFNSVLRIIVENSISMAIEFASENDLNLDAIIQDFKNFLDNAV